MAKNRMSVLRLELRLKAAEALVDGADYESVRRLLAENGVDDADLPSDLTLKNYQDGEEYERYYNERFQVITLPRRMAELAAMEDSTEGMLEMSAMRQLFLRMDAGSLETAHILKILGYLQKRRALKIAEEAEMKSFATMTVSRMDARKRQCQYDRQDAAAAEPYPADADDMAEVAAAREPLATTGSATDDAMDAPAAELAGPVNPSKTDQIRVKPTISATPAFANSPSASTRAAARKKRKRSGR